MSEKPDFSGNYARFYETCYDTIIASPDDSLAIESALQALFVQIRESSQKLPTEQILNMMLSEFMSKAFPEEEAANASIYAAYEKVSSYCREFYVD